MQQTDLKIEPIDIANSHLPDELSTLLKIDLLLGRKDQFDERLKEALIYLAKVAEQK